MVVMVSAAGMWLFGTMVVMVIWQECNILSTKWPLLYWSHSPAVFGGACGLLHAPLPGFEVCAGVKVQHSQTIMGHIPLDLYGSY